ncbi:MAG TPA: hypothetical protein PKH06_03540, partial [Candidatus Dojkabacteria bacterium]|nr:hypothetical protein [Candidatus Dojkabacteria bacterium]
MSNIYVYKIFFLDGTLKYVLEELKQKYPNIKVVKESSKELIFEYTDSDINIFRNLYSPISIEDGKGNRLDLSKREWRGEFVPAGINPSLAYIMCMV